MAKKKEEVTDNIVVENAQLLFRNFSGKASKFNAEGHRNFCVIIDDEKQAQAMLAAGWNVRQTNPRFEDEDPKYYIQVKVNYGYRPPTIYMVTKKQKVLLGEEQVASLDYADICSADLIITPYSWTNAKGESGISAYLKTMYVRIEEDVFADKYSDIPDAGADSIDITIKEQGPLDEDELPF